MARKTDAIICEIPLNGGGFALVDEADFEYLSQWRWTHHPSGYATRAKKRADGWHTIYMHLELLQPSPGLETDHINRNKVDNRRINLRAVPRWLNCSNRRVRSDSASGVRGVHFRKDTHKWTAAITIKGIKRVLGCFLSREEATRAYEEARQEVAA